MELKITDTTETFDSWLGKSFIDDELRKTLAKASILIVPFENLRDTKIPPFPVGTDYVLQYFQNRLPQEQSIDICISDEDYQVFEFNNHYRKIGKFVVLAVAIPAFVNILSSLVYDRFIKPDETKPQIQVIDNSTHTTTINHISTLTDKKYLEPTHIEFSVTIVGADGTSKNIKFEGPATEIDNVLKALKEYEE
jgi:hypothetical protein